MTGGDRRDRPMELLKRLVLVVVLVMLVGPARAGFDEGFAAHERGDYETALKEFHPLAERGGYTAQYNLGIMYANGGAGSQPSYTGTTSKSPDPGQSRDRLRAH